MRILKIALGLVLFLVLTAFVAVKIGSDDRPVGEPGPQAEELAAQIMTAVNCDAWNDIRYVSWEFVGGNQYLWDKHANLVRVRWKNYEVYLDAGTLEGSATNKGEALTGEERDKIIEKAVKKFFNDSFWLNAPCKIMDEGVERSLVEWKDTTSLLVSYSSGGVTPGDAYLWIVDENGLPIRWKMWTSILPVQGMGSTWEGWQTVGKGAKISTLHGLGPKKVEMIRDLATASTLEELEEYGDALAPEKFQP